MLAIFAIVFVVTASGSSWLKSATFDEPGHLALGYAALTSQDYRIDPEHPPLVRMWAALPLLAMPRVAIDMSYVDRTEPNAYARTVTPIPQKFLYFDNDGDTLLCAGRLTIALVGAALGIMLFAWAYEWLGWWPAVIALVFYTLEPNLLSHSSLVTTDLGLTACVFGTMYFCWRAYAHGRRRDLMCAATLFAAAVASKSSAFVFVPVIVTALVMIARRAPRHKLLTAGLLIGGFSALAWLGIWATYDFRYLPSRTDGWRYHFQDDDAVRSQEPGATAVIDWVDRHRLLPNAYAQGLLLSKYKAERRPAFLAGKYSTGGWWYYFPAAFLIKTPLSLLLLVAGGLVGVGRRWRRLGGVTVLFVLAPVIILVAAAMMASINIGLRHILPVYPFLILIGAAGARTVLESFEGRGRILLGALGLAAALELATVYPDTLTFFNLTVGGPRQGEHFLADSNLDWGQDLKPLKRWMEVNGIPQINLAYFGTADPAYYHIDRIDLPGSSFHVPGTPGTPRLPGYVAVSATILTGVYFTEQQRRFYEPFRSMAPVATIGNSMHVYFVSRPWW